MILANVLFAAVLAITATPASRPLDHTYVTPDNTISIRYPSGSTVAEGWPNETGIVSPLVGPPGGRELVDGEWKVALRIDDSLRGSDLRELLRHDCSDGFGGDTYTPVDCRIVTIAGRSWTWTTFRFVSELHGSTRSLRTVFGGKVYSATSTVPDGHEHNAGMAETKRMLLTLRVGNRLPSTGSGALPSLFVGGTFFAVAGAVLRKVRGSGP